MPHRLWQIVPDFATVDAFAEPWQRLYAHSTIVPTLVLFGHVAGLFVAGALSFSTEAGALRLDPADADARRDYLRSATPTRSRIALALAVAIVSGLLLFLADVEAFAVSPVFWTKMCLVGLLLLNAVAATRLDARLRRDDDVSAADDREGLWRRRRASARRTAVLWFALILSGSALASR